MEKLARDIVTGMKLLGMKPDEKKIVAAAGRRGFDGDMAGLVDSVNRLWSIDYFQSYRRLYQGKYGRNAARLLEESCSHVMDRIWNKNTGEFVARRSLIMGDVQAGKTGNFIGQMAMAADLGVRLFVVLTGVTNILRSQTQERVEEGFVGVSSKTDASVVWPARVGVGHNKYFTIPYSYTSMANDHIPISAVHPSILGTPGVIVVKKCRSTLQSLNEWIEHQQKIYDTLELPMLMIDDEADLASLNNNGEYEDRTVINGLITNILNHFKNSAYLGYTATPFANLEGEDELSPNDFLCCLPRAGRRYFGPRNLFLNKKVCERTVRLIEDVDNLPVAYMRQPRSLYKAFRTFLVARAIYATEYNDAGCCMLVNVAHRNTEQGIIYERLNDYWNRWRNKLYNAGAGDDIWRGMRSIYKEEFEGDYPAIWPGIRGYLRSLCGNGVNFYLVNGTERGDNPEKIKNDLARGTTSVLVGGFALARGVTLPELLVSYVIRPQAGDAALMQLGRWFGYRGKYIKLCRVWMPEQMKERYVEVTERINELKTAINNLDPDLPFAEQQLDL